MDMDKTKPRAGIADLLAAIGEASRTVDPLTGAVMAYMGENITPFPGAGAYNQASFKALKALHPKTGLADPIFRATMKATLRDELTTALKPSAYSAGIPLVMAALNLVDWDYVAECYARAVVRMEGDAKPEQPATTIDPAFTDEVPC